MGSDYSVAVANRQTFDSCFIALLRILVCWLYGTDCCLLIVRTNYSRPCITLAIAKTVMFYSCYF